MVTPARIQSRALVTCAPLLLDRNWKLGYSARASGVALCGAVVSLYSKGALLKQMLCGPCVRMCDASSLFRPVRG